jgi:hypothetical protein
VSGGYQIAGRLGDRTGMPARSSTATATKSRASPKSQAAAMPCSGAGPCPGRILTMIANRFGLFAAVGVYGPWHVDVIQSASAMLLNRVHA